MACWVLESGERKRVRERCGMQLAAPCGTPLLHVTRELLGIWIPSVPSTPQV